MEQSAPYSVPSNAAKVFRDGILSSTLTRKHLLDGPLQKYADAVSFEGPDNPILPVNWRFAESMSALKALEAVYVNAILDKLYGIAPQKVKINTNHAILFIMSLQLWSLDPEGRNVKFMDTRAGQEAKDFYLSKFQDFDYYRSLDGPYRCCTSNIYRTADDKFFHLHGSLNPDVVLDMLKLPLQPPKDHDQFHHVLPMFRAALGQWNAEDIDKLSNDVIKTAGSVCYSLEEYRKTEMSRANEHVGLWETIPANQHQKPTWWTNSAGEKPNDPSRPLAGLKVLDATRIIAGPAVTRGLAELGATVLRITTKTRVPDATIYHPEFNWGKRNASLDLSQEADHATFKKLILECDVFVSSYRPTVMEKWGFGADNVLDFCKQREKGIIVVRLNSYGWNGPMRERSGWQQISDAHTGVSWEFGRAMGHEEPVTPLFPNSDFCTGISGICSVLDAVIRRAEQGGSYKINLALDYYNNWLTRNVGVYPEPVWKKLHQHYGSPIFRHDDHMLVLIGKVSSLLQRHSPEVFDPQYLEDRPCPNLGINIRTVKPVLQFADVVRPGFDIGTRGNGVDEPTWA
ncbi:CoA-transferase family III domain protein [Metarhizium guizhouense ARSEF 977]|uniref:CoA-transferase family III domain protein n=1 Tax=Metarhizium guizhouense (strain ARSEF 977) TaxID=1276136 RepID=A0A0B4GF67_METGA|nr:CoA-transferase family III domain protein [Metarhizium guizhouense ARSEF 977]